MPAHVAHVGNPATESVLIAAPRNTARPKHPHAQIEMRGAARQVGGKQRQHHAEHRRADAAERLGDDRQPRARQHAPQQGAQRQCRPAEQQDRPASKVAAPRPSGEHNATTTCGTTMQAAMIRDATLRTHGHRRGDQRQHRRVGQVEQQHAGGKDQQAAVGEQTGAVRTSRTATPWSGAARARRGRSPTTKAGPARRDRSQQEYRSTGDRGAGRTHDGRGQSVADRGITCVASQPLTQPRMPDQVQADRGDRRGEDAAREGVQRLRQQDRQQCRLDRQQQGSNDHAEIVLAPAATRLLCAASTSAPAGIWHDQGDDGAEGQGEADLDLGPFVRCQVDRDKGAEARLHIGYEEVQ